MTTTQNSYRIKDHVITITNSDAMFNSGGDLTWSLSDLLGTCFVNSTNFDNYRGNRRKVMMELQSIHFVFLTANAKNFRVEEYIDLNGTAQQINKIYEDLAATYSQLILMKGIDFDGIVHAFYNSGTDYFHIEVRLVCPAQTIANYGGQVIAVWKEIQG